jgi:hypothetical protein
VTEAAALYYPERAWRTATRSDSVWAGLIGRTVAISWSGAAHPDHTWTLHEVMDADDDWVVLKRVGRDARGGPVVVRLDEIDHARVEG